MTDLQIHCDNCGAKYKLPETFTGNQAKCQKCGSVIDVATQRSTAGVAGSAAAKQPAALPAGARPAKDRSKEAPKAAERPTPAISRRERPARRGGQDEAAGSKRGRNERGTKKSRVPLVLGIVGLVVVVAFVLIVMKAGG